MTSKNVSMKIDDRLFSENDAARVLGLSYVALRQRRYRGRGPAFEYDPRGHVYYRFSALCAYAASHQHKIVRRDGKGVEAAAAELRRTVRGQVH